MESGSKEVLDPTDESSTRSVLDTNRSNNGANKRYGEGYVNLAAIQRQLQNLLRM